MWGSSYGKANIYIGVAPHQYACSPTSIGAHVNGYLTSMKTSLNHCENKRAVPNITLTQPHNIYQ